MLDRRPLLARKFAEAILNDARQDGLPRGVLGPTLRQETLNRWVALILENFTSDSIPFPGNEWVSTCDQPTCEKFLAKYPDLRLLDALCREEALRRWPEATFRYSLHSDPEGCHTCWEGQHLTLEIQTDLEFYGPNGEEYPENSPYNAADQEWQRWMWGWSDDDDDVEEVLSPYRKVEQEIGEVARLFRPDIKWKWDPKDDE